MRDFKQQFQTYSDEMRNTRCPYSEAELDKEIRSVVWRINPSKETIPAHKRRLWPSAVAAAIIAIIIIPTVIFIGKSNTAGEIASLKVGDEHIYFACNNGCTPEGILQNFKALIQ